jgi:hypothetical protein
MQNRHVDHWARNGLCTLASHTPFLYGSNSALRSSVWRKVRAGICNLPSLHEDLDLGIHVYDAGHSIVYDKKLRASISARRYDDTPADFAVYMRMYTDTYRRHGMRTLAPLMATLVYWAGYWCLRWFRTSGSSGRMVALGIRQARKNPAASVD